MPEQKFKASLSRSRGRKSWCVIFKHPLRTGADGRPGFRTRRGLGTDDENVAQKMVDQLNELLSNTDYWKISARENASRKFDDKVIKAFYDAVEVRTEDPWASREKIIPLPDNKTGFSRVLFVGPTGAGKTTLLRQIIGSHPQKDRFPSTSTAKTTVFDTEIILEQGNYRGVVSFLPRDRVRSYVEECVVAAVSSAIEKESDEIILRRFLEHSEQRFRLNYLLGTLPSDDSQNVADMENDDLDINEVTESESISEIEYVSKEERREFEQKLKGFIKTIKQISEELPKILAEELGVDTSTLNHEDHDAFLERLERVDSLLHDHEEAQSLIEDILSEIEDRFLMLEKGSYERDRSDWPVTWVFESDDRREFIKTINKFSSNYATNFGKLLTPLVQGIRIAGPFKPSWYDEDGEIPSYVLIDGEGLGHTPSSASTLPTSVTKRYDIVDAILLTDSATQPMQAASQAVLRSAVSSGHELKLLVAFTHFDQVIGDNLPNISSRKNHILASLENAINGVEEAIGSNAGKRLRRSLDRKVFFVSRIQNIPYPKFTEKQFSALDEAIKSSIVPVEVPEAIPVYDLANLVLCIHSATENFHNNWRARLGLTYKSDVTAEHWTKIKALSRRFANQWEDQYDTLRPVADMIKLLSERIADFITKPRSWKTHTPSEESQQIAVNKVAQEVYSRLHSLISDRLFHDHLHEWGNAYAHRGIGSTRVRARDIRFIYEIATPVPAEAPTTESIDFLDIIREIFRDAAISAGAEVIG